MAGWGKTIDLGHTGKTCALRRMERDLGIKNMYPGGTLHSQLGSNSSMLTVTNGAPRVSRFIGSKILVRQERELKSVSCGSEQSILYSVLADTLALGTGRYLEGIDRSDGHYGA